MARERGIFFRKTDKLVSFAKIENLIMNYSLILWYILPIHKKNPPTESFSWRNRRDINSLLYEHWQSYSGNCPKARPVRQESAFLAAPVIYGFPIWSGYSVTTPITSNHLIISHIDCLFRKIGRNSLVYKVIATNSSKL